MKEIIQKLKYNLITLYVLGLIFTFVSGPNEFDFSTLELIISPFIFLLFFSIIPFLIGLITYLINKNIEKTTKIIKTTLTISTVIFIVFIISTIYV